MYKKKIEVIYDGIFNAVSPGAEWGKWHNRTKNIIQEIKKTGTLPKELSEPTEIKYYSMLSEYILSNITSKVKRTLEVGGGSGALSYYLQRKTNAECTIVDNSEVALEYARLIFNKKEASFILANALKLPMDSGSFDIVHSVGLIEHFQDSDISKMASEMARVLAKGGLLFLAVPNFFSPDMMSIWYRYGKGSERYITKRDLLKIALNNNLKIVSYGHSEFCFSSNVNKIIPLSLEKFLGRNGLGFLNYVLCEKG